MNLLRNASGLIILCLISLQLSAAETIQEEKEQYSLFDSNALLTIDLKTDLKSLLKNKNDKEYQPAEIIVDGKAYQIRLKARGNYRRENCYFPPVTLNFSKTEFDDPSFEQLKKLKLVNACKMQSTYEQYILREYLIYRAFNIFSDKSFKVRLLKINYIDSREKMKTVSRYGFVIEDQYQMAKRLEGMMVKIEGIRDQSTNRQQMLLISLFHFMIGNTDWSVPRLHNLRLLKINDPLESTPYVIPYDFDYTGMVDASYTVPSDVLGIDDIKERIYWGKCYSENELKAAVQIFLDKKNELYELYRTFEHFNKNSTNQSIQYLNSFYTILENERSWKRYFIENCRK